ncbi:MAG: O-antigen ligase family protein [Chloroflexi bacterium]|nr:O-antigen ligase family protein [Chloroflexota bacterium]
MKINEKIESPSRLSILCERLIEAGWLIAVILAPLYLNVNTYRIFDADKMVFIQLCVSGMALAWVIKWLEQRRLGARPWRERFAAPLVLPTLAIVLAQLLTTITAIAPAVSFTGSFTRPQGASIALTYVALFALMAQGLTTRQQFDRLVATLALTSLPIALYGIIQNYGLDPLVWDRDIPGRVFATLGNPIFLGAYLILVFFLTLGQAIASAHAARTAATRVPWLRAGIFGLIALIQAICLLFTISRGPWVGWITGLGFFALMLALVFRMRRTLQTIVVVGLIGVLTLVILNVPNTPLEPIRNAPYIGSLGHIFEGESGTGKVRTLIWEADARIFAERPVAQFPDGTPDRWHLLRPLIGYGPDSMAVIFTQFRLADGNIENTKEDHSHNETWDVLVSTGILGLVAYQWLWLAVFLLGLKWLDLIPTNRERNIVIGLWLGGGFLFGLATILVGQFKYFGIALPAGNLVGLGIFLGRAALRDPRLPPLNLPARQILIAALLAGFIAHYVEIQFGINLTATRVLFWATAALFIAIGVRKLEATQSPQHATEWLGAAASYALVGAIVLVIVLFEFIQRSNNADVSQTFWLALAFNPISQQDSFAILFMLLGVWMAAVALAVSELLCAGVLGRANWRNAFAVVSGSTLGLSALFGLGYSAQVSALKSVPAKLTSTQEGLVVAEQLVGLTDFFSVMLLALFLLMLVALTLETRWQTLGWAVNRWALAAFAPLMFALIVAGNAQLLNPIRADTYNKVGLFFMNAHETDAAVALFSRAIRLAPMTDRYYMLLGNVFANKAFYLDMTNPSQFGDQTQLNDLLNLNAQQIARLNRNDSVYAAQTMYLRAYNFNPLYVDHSANLARLYKPEPPLNTPGKKKLADLTSKYFAEAVRLSPNDVRLWNEWADFDLTYLENSDTALHKLTESAKRDPYFAPTFVAMGDVFKAQPDLARAADAYERALAARIPLAEAARKLAFVYYQQGKLSDAIASYAKFVELAPDAANVWEAHKNIALLYDQAGDRASALRAAQRARDRAPADVYAQLDELIARWRAP